MWEVVNTPSVFTTKVSSAFSIFESEKFGRVRVTLRAGEPWFVAKDVCDCLDLSNVSQAMASLDEDEKITLTNPEGNPRAGIPLTFTVVSEPGLYSLIFRSRKPDAKEFKRWVTHEVLPSIRKTGSYSLQPALPDFNDPVAAARAWADAVEAKRKAEAVTGQLIECVKSQTQQLEKQADELGYGRTWKAVTCIPWLLEYFTNNSTGTCSVVGKYLTGLSREMQLPKKQIPHPQYANGIGCYHVDVIEEFKRRLDANPVLLSRYRV